jgi:AcrR family transcriptional regulator
MQPGAPKFRRRKEARPGEIVEAAFAVFAEKGFAAARLDDIAARAGVSKGALYLYYETKEALFEAVVTSRIGANLVQVREMIATFPGPFGLLLARLVPTMAQVMGRSAVGAIGKMVIGEGRNFPELARYWREAVVEPMLGAMSAAVAVAQARGEVRPGDPRLYALQIASPFLMGVLWRETFVPVGAEPVDLDRLAAQHLAVLQSGLLLTPTSPT